MVVQFYNLGFHVYQAENAQAAQQLFQNQQLAQGQFAAAQSQDAAKGEQSTQVQNMREVENENIAGDGRGAHSYMLEKEEEKEEKKEKDKIPEDPTGKGKSLDMTG